MPIRSVAVILNPAAGNRRAGRARALIERALEASSVDFEVMVTERPNQAATLARRAAPRFDAVFAAGGDGTVNEVASGLAETDGAALGIIPIGTGNDFATLLGMPKRPAEAVQALLDAEVVTVDGGTVRWQEADGASRVHEAVFVNASGVGFDALVAAEAERLKKFRGISGYVVAVWKALRTWGQPDVAVRRLGQNGQPGEEIYAGPFFAGAVHNGVSVGGGFRLTPNAVVDDGLLDLCLIKGPLTTRRVFTLLPKGIKGKHTTEPEVIMGRGPGFGLRISEGVPIHVDGEVLTRSAVRVEIEVRPRAFRVLRPIRSGARAGESGYFASQRAYEDYK